MLTATSARTGEIGLAGWTETVKRSALQEMLTLGTGPDFISFALGLPAQELFPSAAIEEAVVATLRSGRHALQYGPPLPALKRQVVALMQERGVRCCPEQVFLTCGAQQGMNLLARVLLAPARGSVLLEEMAYTGFQQVLTPYQPTLLTVPTNPESGIDLASVEALLAGGARPAFMYTVTDGHNPMGVSISQSNRSRLVELARRYRTPIVEDDAYGFLFYEEASPPPLRALDDRWVFYVGSFSKILAPSLRAGWIIVPEELMTYLSVVKEASDIDMATLSHRTISAYLEAGQITEHLKNLRQEYRHRRDAMLRALEEHFPTEARWRRPASGFFIWVDLPAAINTTDLLKSSIAEAQVGFIPGQAFSVNGERGSHSLRLNFSNQPAARIEEGIARLGRLIKKSHA
ncbi:MAG: PLP-dependent aminotransferase family protein [Acidobacteriota bacterium]